MKLIQIIQIIEEGPLTSISHCSVYPIILPLKVPVLDGLVEQHVLHVPQAHRALSTTLLARLGLIHLHNITTSLCGLSAHIWSTCSRKVISNWN